MFLTHLELVVCSVSYTLSLSWWCVMFLTHLELVVCSVSYTLTVGGL